MLAELRTIAVRYRKPVAVVGSVGLHLVLIWLLLTPSSSRLAELDKRALGALTQEGMNVDLVPPAPASTPPMPAAPPKPPQTQAIEAFAAMSQPTTAATSPSLSAPSPAKSLSDVFGKDVFAPSPASPPRAETQHPSNQENHIKLANQDNRATPNDLWKAIEPCWRR